MSFRGAPQKLYATMRSTLAHIDPNLAIVDLRSLDDQLAGRFNQERLIGTPDRLFGLLTLVLASVGLYGITSYQVTQKTGEIGRRMALGAHRNRVAGLVMRGALRDSRSADPPDSQSRTSPGNISRASPGLHFCMATMIHPGVECRKDVACIRHFSRELHLR
jgi:hypothetical protein